MNSYTNDPLSIHGSVNPMKHYGRCDWTLDNGTDISVYFEYFRQFGTLYVNEIDYVSPSEVDAETLREAVRNELGPCQFDETVILRSK